LETALGAEIDKGNRVYEGKAGASLDDLLFAVPIRSLWETT